MLGKVKKVLLLLSLVFVLTACGSARDGQEVSFSENILFSINNGSAGSGSRYACMDADIIVYCDGSIQVMMKNNDGSGAYIPVTTLQLSEEDYEELAEVADRELIYEMETEENRDVCDGSSRYITLYDENDEVLIVQGGYMPEGEEFWEVYSEIKEILEPYGISEIVDEYRDYLEDYDSIYRMIEGRWVSEGGSDVIEVETRYDEYNEISGHWILTPETYAKILILQTGLECEFFVPLEEIAENELIVMIDGVEGELEVGIEFVVDLNGEYIYFPVHNGTEWEWTYFYPEVE